MIKYYCTFFLFSVFLTSNLSAQNFIGKQKEINKILKGIENFSSYYVNGETAKLVDCYTKDGKIFPNNSQILDGTVALTKFWSLPEGVKILRHKITPSEIRIVKKTAYDYGHYEGETQRPNGETVPFKGKYIIVWKKVGKVWKIYLDMWNNI